MNFFTRKSSFYLFCSIACGVGAVYALRGDHSIMVYAQSKLTDDPGALESASIGIIALVIAKPLSGYIASVLPKGAVTAAKIPLFLVSFFTMILICITVFLARVKVEDVAKTDADTARTMSELRKQQAALDLNRAEVLQRTCASLSASGYKSERIKSTDCIALQVQDSATAKQSLDQLEATLRKRGKTTRDVLGEDGAMKFALFNAAVFSFIAFGLSLSSGALYRMYRQQREEEATPTPLPYIGTTSAHSQERSQPGTGALRSAPEHLGARSRAETAANLHQISAENGKPLRRRGWLTTLIGIILGNAGTNAGASQEPQEQEPDEVSGKLITSTEDDIYIRRENGRVDIYHRESKKHRRDEWESPSELLPPRKNPKDGIYAQIEEVLLIRRLGADMTHRNIRNHLKIGNDQAVRLTSYMRQNNLM